MAILGFQSLMLPLLKLAADRAEHTLAGSVELARLMFGFGVGVTPIGAPCVLKRVDLDFFGDV